MSIRIGVNGIGRIGRNLWRIIHTSAPDVEIVAINDIAGAETVVICCDTARSGAVSGEVVTTADRGGWPSGALDPTQSTGADPWREYGGGPGAGVDWTVHSRPGRGRAPPRRRPPGLHRLTGRGCEPMMGSTDRVRPAAAPDRVQLLLHHVLLGDDPACPGPRVRVVSATATVAYAYGGGPVSSWTGCFRTCGWPAPTPSPSPGGRARGAASLNRVLPELAGRVAATAIRVPGGHLGRLDGAVVASRQRRRVNQTLEVASATVLKKSWESVTSRWSPPMCWGDRTRRWSTPG